MDCRAPGRCATYCVLLNACLIGFAGCGESPGTPPSTPGAKASARPAEDSADRVKGQEITDKMLAAYRKAGRYTDHATYVQHSVYRGEGVERDLPFFHMAVAFERPNRLRLSFEEAVEGSAGRKGFDIASDGTTMRCQVGELPGQVQESAAPRELSGENLLPDPLVREVFADRTLGDVFPQLAMLLNREEDGLVFPADEAPRLLDKARLRDRECYRVASTSPKGQRIFWIDCENYALHRMELPIDAERDQLDAENQFSKLAIWIDFEQATFDAQIDAKAFDMEVPADARRVRRFVALPPEAPPKELGEAVANFQFAASDGKKVTPAELAGKTVLLDFWQVDCAPCKAHTPNLEQAYQQLKDDEKFAFYAVNLDGSRIDEETAGETLKAWGGTMPVLLDSEQDAFKKLHVEGTPTLMMLDPEGRLQYLHVRRHDDPKALAELVKKVMAGGDLAAEARAEHRQLTAKFRRDLEAATIKEATVDIELPKTEISERALPTSLTASEMWATKAEVVGRPGNVVVFSPEELPSEKLDLLVLDGAEAVVRLDRDGKRTYRYEIADGIAAATGDGILRAGYDDSGGYWFAVSGLGWPKLQVFNDQGKSILQFPKDRHPGIADVLFWAIDDGPRLCVGYRGGLGVQEVDLEGKRRWSERTLDQVVQLASTRDSNRKPELWCTSNRGTVLVLNGEGQPVREFAVGEHSLMYVAANGSDEAAPCCGLAVEGVGRYRAVGFTTEGEVQWQYELPAGEYSHTVERIQHVKLPGDIEAWMISAADGSIIWLDSEGKLVDKFQYGEPLTGLALANRGDLGILLVSTPTALTAWKLEKK